jgi:lysozyme
MEAGPKKLAAFFVLSVAGIAGITQYEGKVNKVYLDPIAIPTVCVGHTATVSRKDVGKAYSDALCADLLRADTRVATQAVQRAVRVPVTQEQYDALVSFTFNVGGGALSGSTLVRKFNAGDCYGAAAEFTRWNKAGGKVLPGLVKRRAWEQQLFKEGC